MIKQIAILITLLAIGTFAGVELALEPRSLSGVPGEVLRVELTVEAERAENALLRVPHTSNLVLRAIESYPVERNRHGRFVQKKALLFQGVEAGSCVMTNLLVEINGTLHPMPPLVIEVRAVKPAAWPIPIAGKSDEEGVEI
ncbi:MAG: hypothetical protein PHO37_19070 [Kiritimatiellae bacterium]|nr:hypothetical protein [Kiritimatiellia bacterium]